MGRKCPLGGYGSEEPRVRRGLALVDGELEPERGGHLVGLARRLHAGHVQDHGLDHLLGRAVGGDPLTHQGAEVHVARRRGSTRCPSPRRAGRKGVAGSSRSSRPRPSPRSPAATGVRPLALIGTFLGQDRNGPPRTIASMTTKSINLLVMISSSEFVNSTKLKNPTNPPLAVKSSKLE